MRSTHGNLVHVWGGHGPQCRDRSRVGPARAQMNIKRKVSLRRAPRLTGCVSRMVHIMVLWGPKAHEVVTAQPCDARGTPERPELSTLPQ